MDFILTPFHTFLGFSENSCFLIFFEQTFRSNFFSSENLGCGVEGIGSISPHLTKRIQTRRTWRLFKIKTRKVLDEETFISSALIIFESNFSKRQTHALILTHTHLRTYTHTVHRETIHNGHRKARRWTRILGFEPRPAVRKAKF